MELGLNKSSRDKRKKRIDGEFKHVFCIALMFLICFFFYAPSFNRAKKKKKRSWRRKRRSWIQSVPQTMTPVERMDGDPGTITCACVCVCVCVCERENHFLLVPRYSLYCVGKKSFCVCLSVLSIFVLV